MAVSLVGYVHTYITNNTPVNVTLPSGSAAGDLVIHMAAAPIGGSVTPTNFTVVDAAQVSDNMEQFSSKKVLTGTDITNNYVTMPGDPSFNGCSHSLWVFSDTTTPLVDDSSIIQANDATEFTTICNTGTAAVASASGLFACVQFAARDDGTTWSAVSGDITVDQNVPVRYCSMLAGHFTTSGSGAISDHVATINASYSREHVAVIIVKPASSDVSAFATQAAVTVTGYNATTTGGAVATNPWFPWAETDGIQFVWDATVAELKVGYDSPDSRGVIVGKGAATTATAASTNAQATLASISVTAYGPVGTVKPIATQAAVSVAGFPATPSVKPIPTQGAIAVTAYGPVGVVTVVGGLASVGVTANQPAASVKPVAGQAPVSVAGFNATTTSLVFTNAQATQAAVSVAGHNPLATIKPVAGQAAVSVAGFDATVSTNVFTNAQATQAAIAVTAFGPVATVKPVAGQAPVSVTGFDAIAVTGALANATAAAVSVAAFGATPTVKPVAGQAPVSVAGFDATTTSQVVSRWARRITVIRPPIPTPVTPGIARVDGGHGLTLVGSAYSDIAPVLVIAYNAKTTVVAKGAGQAVVTVAGQAAQASVRANVVTAAAISVVGFNATTTSGGVPGAGLAPVVVTGFDATTVVSGVPDRITSRRVVLRQPRPRPPNNIMVQPGGMGDIPDRYTVRRFVIKARYAPVTTSIRVIEGGGGVAQPGVVNADIAFVSVVGQLAKTSIKPKAGQAVVTVQGFNATATQGTAVTGATTAAVGVQGFNATCKVSPRAGLASVAITAFDADTPTQIANATHAPVSVQGFNATTTSFLAATSAMATLAPISVKGFDATTRVLRGDDKVWPVTWWTPRTWVSDIGVRDLNRYVRDNIKSMRQKQVMDVAAVFAAATTQYTNAAPFNSTLMANVIGAARADILDTFLWGVPHESMVMHLIGTLEVKADGTSGIPSSFMINFVDNAGQDFTAGSYEGINFYYAAPSNVAMSIPFIATLDGPVTYGYQLQMSVASGGLFNIVVNASVIFAPKSFAATVDLPNLILDDAVFGRLDFDDLP